MKKIIVFIPSFGKKNILFLKNTINTLLKFKKYDVSIILYTTEEYNLNTSKIEIKKYSIGIEKYLVHEYKKDLIEQEDNYDIFLYIEDDILVKEENIDSFLEENEKIPSNYIIGFLRYEIKNDVEYFNELSKINTFHGTKLSYLVINDKKYFKIPNVHQASFILEKRNLSHLIKDKKFTVYFKYTLEDAASNFFAGIWPGSENGLKKIYPVDGFEKLMVYHQPNIHCHWDNLDLMTLPELKNIIRNENIIHK